MILSSDYHIRGVVLVKDLTQSLTRKVDTNNESLQTVAHLVGAEQRFLDISRCRRLSSTAITENLTYFLNLNYLDLSYTNVSSLVPLQSCSTLKGLMFAGNSLPDSGYETLSALTTLEVLSLRGCRNIKQVDELRNLVCLRHLDLGFTFVSNIEPLSQCTRLEQLLLDHSYGLQDQKCVANVVHTVSRLSSLRVLNVCGTELEKWSEQLLERAPSGALLEPLSRRLCFDCALFSYYF